MHLRKFALILQSTINRWLLIIDCKMLNLVATCMYQLQNDSLITLSSIAMDKVVSIHSVFQFTIWISRVHQ